MKLSAWSIGVLMALFTLYSCTREKCASWENGVWQARYQDWKESPENGIHFQRNTMAKDTGYVSYVVLNLKKGSSNHGEIAFSWIESSIKTKTDTVDGEPIFPLSGSASRSVSLTFKLEDCVLLLENEHGISEYEISELTDESCRIKPRSGHENAPFVGEM